METLINFHYTIKIFPSYQIANIFIPLMRTCARLCYICGPDKTAIKLSIFKKQLTLSNSRKPNERSQKKPITYLFFSFLGEYVDKIKYSQ